jgi:hypothetical protein
MSVNRFPIEKQCVKASTTPLGACHWPGKPLSRSSDREVRRWEGGAIGDGLEVRRTTRKPVRMSAVRRTSQSVDGKAARLATDWKSVVQRESRFACLPYDGLPSPSVGRRCDWRRNRSPSCNQKGPAWTNPPPTTHLAPPTSRHPPPTTHLAPPTSRHPPPATPQWSVRR